MAMGVADQRAWVICVTVLAADAEMDAITDRIGAAICGSLDHPSPCTNPWDILTVRFDDLDDDDRVRWIGSVDTLLEQRCHERQQWGQPGAG